GVGHRVGAASAVLRGDGHAQQVVLARQREHLVVEAMLDVSEFFDRPDLLAERLDVGQQLFRVRRGHGRASLVWREGSPLQCSPRRETGTRRDVPFNRGAQRVQERTAVVALEKCPVLAPEGRRSKAQGERTREPWGTMSERTREPGESSARRSGGSRL